MRIWLIGCVALAAAAPAAAQTMWWVEGDRFCGGFNNNFRNNIMCGAPRRGETLPGSTFRYEFNTPSYNLDREAGPSAAPAAPPQPGARAPRRN
jgi:hypothetical protein